MSFFDTVRGLFTGDTPAPAGLAAAEGDAGRVVAELLGVLDPELGIDIVNMGLVREVEIGEDGRARVRMTLSTPGCPVGPAIVEEVEEAVRAAGFEPDVEVEFDPPWSPDQMSAEGRARLRRG